jgi:hypothetical protein
MRRCPTLRAGRRAQAIPGQRLVNLVVRDLLRTSGLSALIGTRLLTLYAVGRKSGRRYSVPVAYLADGDDLLLGTSARWSARGRDGLPDRPPISSRLHGGTGCALAPLGWTTSTAPAEPIMYPP